MRAYGVGVYICTPAHMLRVHVPGKATFGLTSLAWAGNWKNVIILYKTNKICMININLIINQK